MQRDVALHLLFRRKLSAPASELPNAFPHPILSNDRFQIAARIGLPVQGPKIEQHVADFAGGPMRAVMQFAAEHDGGSDACVKTDEDEIIGSAAELNSASAAMFTSLSTRTGRSNWFEKFLRQFHIAPAEYVVGLESRRLGAHRRCLAPRR